MDDDLSIIDPTEVYRTPPQDGAPAEAADRALIEKYRELTASTEVRWELVYRLIRKLGAGGQGVVFLASRRGAFGATFRLALKMYRPEGYAGYSSYRSEMARLARVASVLARIQQDHLLDIYNVIELDGLHILSMEWVDGYDLRHLLKPKTMDLVEESADARLWRHVNEVVVTRAAQQLRLKPGVAIAIVRECLTGLAALHRHGIVHADLKPSNLMIKRTGNCKLIDFGSAFMNDDYPHRPTWTQRYAAVEVLEGQPHTPQSDLASLGYVLCEMLSGEPPFEGLAGPELIAAKRALPDRLSTLIPPDVARNSTLMSFLKGMIAPDPSHRFASAEDAELQDRGANAFERELVRANLSSDYENEIRLWLAELS
jgi:serine/threonine protein kinase